MINELSRRTSGKNEHMSALRTESSSIDASAAAVYPDVVADTIPKLLLAAAARWPDHVWMRHKRLGIWQPYTWRDGLEHVRAFALGLAALGVRRGETVAMMGENEPELFWTEYAALALGARTTATYPDATPAETKYILGHSEACVVVAEDQEQVDKVLELVDGGALPAVRRIVYWDPRGLWKYEHPLLIHWNDVEELGRRRLLESPGAFESMVGEGRPSDVAAISYTSGTTGLPKGAILTHANLIDSAYRVLMAVPQPPFTEYLSYISPAWAWEHLVGVTLGLLAPLVVNFPEEPETVQENMREIGVGFLTLGPRQWEGLAATVQAHMLDASWLARKVFDFGMLIGDRVASARLDGHQPALWWRLLHPLANLCVLRPLRDRLGLSHAGMAMAGSTGMAPDVYRFFHAMGVQLRNGYGMTEYGLLSIHQGESYDLATVGRWYRSHPSFGPPLEWKLSEDGELLIRGASGFAGYFKNPEATEAKFTSDGWFRTGDAFATTDSGELVFLERMSDLRELATGVRYPPQFVETRLRFSPFIKEVLTLGDRDKDFVAALVNIDAEMTARWAERHHIVYTTFADLSQRQEVTDLVRGEIERVNRLLPRGSRVRRAVNLPKELDPDEGELTRSRKLRRSVIEDRYRELVAALYQGQTEHVVEVPVAYRDGRTGIQRMPVRIIDVGTAGNGG